MTKGQEKFIRSLLNKKLGGWTIREYINSGKSASVFKAVRKGTTGAVKIFEPELIERFGRDVQHSRITRELELVGKHFPSLIKILDGGHDVSKDLYFIVMEFFDGPNLADAIKSKKLSTPRQ